MNLVEFLVEPLRLEFMVRAIAITVIASVVCATLSCWLVLIGWSLMGDAVSHAVLPGVVLAHIAGAPFALGAILFGFAAVALVGVVRDTGPTKEDAAIGVVFTTLFALGLVLISVTPSHVDLHHIIFGSVLGVSRSDLTQVAVLGIVTLAVLVYKRRDFTLYAFDPNHAHALGLNPRLLGAALLGLLALTAVVALQAVGVVLVVALLITPGATAHLLTNRFGRMLLIAPTLAAACALIGLYASYHLDTASGPMVVLANGAAFTLAYLFRLGHTRGTTRRNPTSPRRLRSRARAG
ncbi:metal ABC transporter permease [Mycolicibacterium confluentis]|uniref:Membrane protein n=1 Tax=Mycolicibacterium confluentis TaxID=28047 RepID=A0A7I7XWR1_9MYCO|nr:metal ABC transporter permease [Mycolicibacterium confluentis]MCV7321861.1 metal ABC transporter permease [Mycolicibacterium confluentis]ORV32116.1 hypothetical protein AWB99_10690 [Mycolicibacterium confluentis]BBZ33677.1 membrane protein [Mycolicibacterium confluentis]